MTRAFTLVANWLTPQIILGLMPLMFRCNIMGTDGSHQTFVDLRSFFLLPGPRVYSYITPEAPRGHHRLPDCMPVSRTRHVEDNHMTFWLSRMLASTACNLQVREVIEVLTLTIVDYDVKKCGSSFK